MTKLILNKKKVKVEYFKCIGQHHLLALFVHIFHSKKNIISLSFYRTNFNTNHIQLSKILEAVYTKVKNKVKFHCAAIKGEISL